jgi:hypothetical protein
MFSKDTKVKFFHSDFLDTIEREVNTFIETLPEEYQISYMRYCPPKYAGAQYVVYIIYEPMVVYNWNDITTKDWMKNGIESFMEE